MICLWKLSCARTSIIGGIILLIAPLLNAFAQAKFEPITPISASENLIAQAVKAIGVTHCQNAIVRLSTEAIKGARIHDVVVDWDRSNPSTGAFFSLAGVELDGQAIALSISAMSQANNSTCAIAVERISSAPFTCKSVAEIELKNFTANALLPTFTVYVSHSNPNDSVSLIDTPPACLIVRRYVQYDWRDDKQSDIFKNKK